MLKLINNIFTGKRATIDAPPKAGRYANSGGHGRAESLYASNLMSVARGVDDIVSSYDPYDDASGGNVLNALKEYSKSLRDWAQNEAQRMTKEMVEVDERKWKQQSLKMSKALYDEINKAPIDEMLKEYMNEQVVLIRSMPLQAAERVHKLILERASVGGARADSLVKEIMKTGKVTESRAKLIARTEISKISTGLTKSRSKTIGADFYIWRTSKDIRVRDSHKHMEGVLINWNDPPSPEQLIGKKSSLGKYHAGEAPNDRCFPEPVINVEQVTFPAKMYRNGRIERISKEKFLSMFEDVKQKNAA